mgnify:FL=1
MMEKMMKDPSLIDYFQIGYAVPSEITKEYHFPIDFGNPGTNPNPKHEINVFLK